MAESNPYSPPSQVDEKLIHRESVEIEVLSSECRRNLSLTSKIVRFASVVFGIGSVVLIILVWDAFRTFGNPGRWGQWIALLVTCRVAYASCGLLLTWMLWKYAKSLDRMAIRGTVEIENVMERQTRMWLAVGLLLFVMLIHLAMTLWTSTLFYDD